MATTVGTPPEAGTLRPFNYKTGFSLLAMALLFIDYSMPQAAPYTAKFLWLSHRQSSTGLYSIGNGDFIWTKESHFANMDHLWTGWPQRDIDGLTKFYILTQLSYWIQQVISVNIEARRKDYWLNVVHHFITITLILVSYVYHHTRVGVLILVMMDAIEILFPFAKCLRYLGYTTLCDVVFCLFFITWVLSRHVLYLMTCWSVYSDVPRIMEASCFIGSAGNLHGPLPVPDDWWHLIEPWLYPNGIVCHSNGFRISILVYLLLLQVLMMMWFGFICKVAIGVLGGRVVDDVRSDEESDEGPQITELEKDTNSFATVSSWQESRLQPRRSARSSSAAQVGNGGNGYMKRKAHGKEE